MKRDQRQTNEIIIGCNSKVITKMGCEIAKVFDII